MSPAINALFREWKYGRNFAIRRNWISHIHFTWMVVSGFSRCHDETRLLFRKICYGLNLCSHLYSVVDGISLPIWQLINRWQARAQWFTGFTGMFTIPEWPFSADSGLLDNDYSLRSVFHLTSPMRNGMTAITSWFVLGLFCRLPPWPFWPFCEFIAVFFLYSFFRMNP